MLEVVIPCGLPYADKARERISLRMEGLPYQTLIASQLLKYAAGRLKEV
jgi:hypothetical protein